MKIKTSRQNFPSIALITDQKGQGLTEYLILILLIAVVSIATVKSIGNTVKDKFQQVRSKINEEVTVN